MAQVPAVVAEHRQEVVAAQARCDLQAANLAYSRELQALAEAQAQGTGTEAPSRAVVPASSAERLDGVLGALDAMEPGGAAELRRIWGGDLAQNLGYAGWTLDRYSVRPFDTEPQLLQAGIALGKQVYGELHAGAGVPSPLPPATVNAFLAEFPPAEAATIRSWLGAGIGAELAYVSWLLGKYGGGIALDSEVGLLRLAAAIGRGVCAELNTRPAAGRAATSTQGGNMEVQAMTADDFDEALDLLRQEQREQQALGNHRRANRAMAQEFALIEARQGGARPVVGSGQRYV